MNTKTNSSIKDLGAVAVQAVESYGKTGKVMANAYCNGVRRAVERAGAGYGQWQVEENIRNQMADAHRQWNGFVVDRAETDTQNAIAMIDKVTETMTQGIDTMTTQMQAINVPGMQALMESVSALNMPLAQLSVKIADQMAAGVQQMEAHMAENANVTDLFVKTPAPRATRKAA